MTRRRTSLLASCFLPLVAFLLLGVVAGSLFVAGIPAQAADRFGPPAPGLSSFQAYRLSLQLLLARDELLKPVDPAGEAVQFDIQLNESTASVINRLGAQGLVRSADALRNYMVYAGLDTALQAGSHELSPAMTALQIAQALQSASPGQTVVSVLAGWRIEEIAAGLPSAGVDIAPEAFIQAAHGAPDWELAGEIPSGAGLEGFLFPGTYESPRRVLIQTLLAMMLNRYAEKVSGEIRSGFSTQGLTIYQATTLASLVQREAVVEDEMPTIASVFLNRLAQGMKLDSDPTVQYAIGYNNEQHRWWTNPLTAEDLQTRSPYNSYQNAGLPPGPIDSPSLAALRAVAFPAQTPYYYFRARCDGSGRHAFAETYQQHLENACP